MSQIPMQGGQFDPMWDYYLETADLQPQEREVARQRAMAQQLRGMGQVPEGTMGRYGGYQTARSPLENIAAPMLAAGLGAYQDKQALGAEKSLGGLRKDALGRVKARRDASRMPAPQSGGAAPSLIPQPGDAGYGYESPL